MQGSVLKGICSLRSVHGSISVSTERAQSSTFFCLFSHHFIFSFPLIFFFSFLLVFSSCFFFSLLFFLKMESYYYEFTMICDMRTRNPGVTLPLVVKLCALESSACKGNSWSPSRSGCLYAREIAILVPLTWLLLMAVELFPATYIHTYSALFC
jgi:hypothetical protein